MTAGRWRLAPDNGRLVAVAALAAALVTAIPLLLGTAAHLLLVAGGLVVGAAMLFSPRRTLAALLIVTAVLPVRVADLVRLPLNLRIWEVLLAAGLLFGLVDLVLHDRLRLRRTSVDGLVLAFLGVCLVGTFIGVWYGNDAVWRNARFPFYYVAFFLTVQGVRGRDVTRLFVPLFVAAGVVVSAEYVLEFLGAVDLSTGERFVRVTRRQGVMLPVTLLLLANWMVHDSRRWGRPVLLGLFLFTSLGFGVTLGRGMWAAFCLGLLVTVWLWHTAQPPVQRSRWKALALAAGIVLTLLGTVLAFQRVTGAAISAHAVERSRTFVDYHRDIQILSRLLNYATAAQEIVKHPVLGSGQGATVTSYRFDAETNTFSTWESWTLDSLYLTLWLKLGLAGLVVFPWLGWRVWRCALRAFRASREPSTRAFCAAAAAILAGMGLLGVSDGSLINGRFALVFAVLFGLVMVVDGTQDGDPEAPNGP